MREDIIETKGGKIWYCVYGEEKKGIPLLVLPGASHLHQLEKAELFLQAVGKFLNNCQIRQKR